MSIESRIQGRKDCAELLAELGGDDDYRAGVARACLEHASDLVPKLLTMTEEQAKQFANEQIKFGRYCGRRFGDIPRDYLEWMADEAVRLQSYLRATS